MDEIDSLKDEAQNALDSMPEHLQETSSSGQTLQEYVDMLEEWYNDLDAIDTDIDEGLSEDDVENRVEEVLGEIKEYGCPL